MVAGVRVHTVGLVALKASCEFMRRCGDSKKEVGIKTRSFGC